MALAEIRSYLTGLIWGVVVGNAKSQTISLSFDVPQGSVLGPILFTMYTCPTRLNLQEAWHNLPLVC